MSETDTSAFPGLFSGEGTSRLLTAAVVTAVGFATLSLIGWVARVPVLTSGRVGWRVMVPNTALGVIVCGAATLLIFRGRRTPPRGVIRGVQVALGGVLLLAGATIVEYATGVALEVEHWLGFTYPDEAVQPFAGRMSPMVAVTLSGLATSVLVASTFASRWARIVDGGALIALFFGWLALVGFSLDLRLLENRPRFPGMALQTALSFALLGLALLLRPGGFLAAEFTRDTPGSATMRRLLPAAVLMPVVIPAAQAFGIIGGGLDSSGQVIVGAVVFTTAMGLLILANARRLDAIDSERRRAEAALRESHSALDAKVAERTAALAAANTALEEQIRRAEQYARERDSLLERERQARERAERADVAKDAFLAAVSHELRTPLHAIVGWLHLLRQEELGAEGWKHAVDVIDRNVKAELHVVDDLLDMARIVRGDVAIAPELVDTAREVRSVLESLAPAAIKKGVTLDGDISEAPAVPVDPERFRQIVANLVANALKFTPPGGRIEVQHHVGDETLQLVVRDTGAGMSPAMLEQVFEPFRQGSVDGGRRERGLGLGLSIARSLVSRHGGTIRAHSDGADQGSTFTVTLPIRGQPSPAPVTE